MGDIVRMVRGGRFIGWYVRYKDTDGRRKQRASHQPTRELARRYLLEVEGRVARGLLGIPEPAPPSLTVAELVERFLTEYSRPRIKDLTSYRKHARTALRRVLPHLGSRPADAVTPADIERLRLLLSRRLAPASVRAAMSFLGVAYSWALSAKLTSTHPCRGVERPAVEPALDYLDRAEVQAILLAAERRAAAGGPSERALEACVHLALHTGLRKGELFGLRRKDLDLDARRLTIARSFGGTPKAGKARHLRLPAECVALLATWLAECPPTPEGVVFPVLRPGKPPTAGREDSMMGLDELIADAGCRRFAHPWHALRHTFASHFIMAGGNILTLQRILGHRDLRVTLQYAHLAPDFLGDEMDRLRYR